MLTEYKGLSAKNVRTNICYIITLYALQIFYMVILFFIRAAKGFVVNQE